MVNFLAGVGELKAFQPILTGNTFTHCFFEYQKTEDAETCLTRLTKEKFKGRTVNIKRAALMGEGRVGAGLRAKGKSMFEKDIHSHFLTFDTVGFFQTVKISCVLVLRNVISSPSEQELIKEDIRKEVAKIGPLTRLLSKDRHIYLEY